MSVSRDRLDELERSVRWLAWPEARLYGPGLTADEAATRHHTFLRGGNSSSSSGSYHNVRVAPETDPGAEWSSVYPIVVIGQDPWIAASEAEAPR